MCAECSILEKEATHFALTLGADLEATRLAWEACASFIRARLDKNKETRIAVTVIDVLTEKDPPPAVT